MTVDPLAFVRPTVYPACSMKKCVFFDRDGIVNRIPDPDRYVMSVDRFHLYPAFMEALRIVNQYGYAAILITNQSGVDRGILSAESLEAIHAHLREQLQKEGLGLQDIFVCTSADDLHPHRKPNPGMLLAAAEKHQLDLAHSWMVGDKESDVTAGHRAGCKAIKVSPSTKPSQAEYQIHTLDELPALLNRLLGDV